MQRKGSRVEGLPNTVVLALVGSVVVGGGLHRKELGYWQTWVGGGEKGGQGSIGESMSR